MNMKSVIKRQNRYAGYCVQRTEGCINSQRRRRGRSQNPYEGKAEKFYSKMRVERYGLRCLDGNGGKGLHPKKVHHSKLGHLILSPSIHLM